MSMNAFASKLVRVLFSLQMDNIEHHLFPVIVAALVSHSGAEPQQMNKITSPFRELNKKASLASTLGCVFVAILCFILLQLYVCHEFSDENHRNPIIKVIEKCPIFVYSKLKRLRTGICAAECAVCLTEFRDRDTIKMLPKCKHVFHQQCIDAWLPSHMSCPICRQRVKNDTVVDIDAPTIVTMEHGQQQLGSVSTGYIESEVAVTAISTAPDITISRAHESRRLWRSFSTGHSLKSFTEMFPGYVRWEIVANPAHSLWWSMSLTTLRSGGGICSSMTESKTSFCKVEPLMMTSDIHPI